MSLSFKIFANFLDLRKNNIIKFFFKNECRISILLLSVTRFEENIIKNFEFYYKNIPDDISSKININTQIDLAIAKGYLAKKKSNIDKRSTIITASDETVDQFNKLIKIIKKNLD
jgi:hypothetical protein